jgi:uncharacterized protein
MNCPVCNVPLNITDRQGVEIDYCPRCRGVWLDRGELDKIIERSETAGYGATGTRGGGGSSVEDHNRYDERSRHTEHGGSHYQQQQHNQPYKKHKKREGFLSELFDFD